MFIRFCFSKTVIVLMLMITLVLGSVVVYGAEKGQITGYVKAAESGDPLPGANVTLEKTTLGAATDLYGKYRILEVPQGTYDLVISYVGYQKTKFQVIVEAGQTVRQDAELQFDVIQLKEIVVTEQLEGQAKAINQQLSANTIVNVVSPDKIHELPDQNAAESVGRLPGISIQRNAGEGQKVIVRGLSPRFNSITVNGERIPSTDSQDRSVDLSMLSPDVLAGIEVYKALTPDKDGDAIGGTVNFVTKKAREGLRLDVRMQSGYNGHDDKYGQYKNSISFSNRYWDNKLGAVITGSMQRANRGSDYMEADYIIDGEKEDGTANILVKNLNLGDRLEVRKRYSVSLTLDYELGLGDLFLNSFWGKTDRDELRRRRRYNLEANRQERTMRSRQLLTNMWTNSMNGQHYLFPLGHAVQMNWRASYSRTIQETPFSHTTRFYELSAFKADIIMDQGPIYIPLAANNRLDETYFKSSLFEEERVDDEDMTAQVDFQLPFTVGDDVSGHVKMGGKFRGKNRDREVSALGTTSFGLVWDLPEKYPDRWDLDSEGRILVSNFVDTGFEANDFVKGEYEFGPGLDESQLNDFFAIYRNETFGQDPASAGPLYIYDSEVLIGSYEASEKISASYLLVELNLGNTFLFLPGVRYEKTTNDYAATYATPIETEDEEKLIMRGVIDTTGVRSYEKFLPMFHIRYKPKTWFDIRLAATRTLSRPNYYNLVPWRTFTNEGATLEQGNPDLKPVISWNYDCFLSFNNRLGLFTIGLFTKEVENVDYTRTRHVEKEEDLGKITIIIQPENVEKTTHVKGYEVELQTNLKTLPSPFNGVVIYANYSHISSETFYPFLLVEHGPPPFFMPIFIDTLRTAPMIGQSDHIANLSLGYEKGGFSGRVSMIYQGNILNQVDIREQLDEYKSDFIRWDIALQQRVHKGVSLFVNLNNISDRSEGTFLWKEMFPTNDEFFGWTADLGIRYKF
ncbi:MAG: TonB-dependent receptor [Gemmatimonadota bacterium]|nr:MAG: TonB-dependent receptor [Gemmatimonadota bacterium]